MSMPVKSAGHILALRPLSYAWDLPSYIHICVYIARGTGQGVHKDKCVCIYICIGFKDCPHEPTVGNMASLIASFKGPLPSPRSEDI